MVGVTDGTPGCGAHVRVGGGSYGLGGHTKAESMEVGGGLFGRTVGGPITMSASAAFGDLHLDPSEPMTRTVKPKRERTDG